MKIRTGIGVDIHQLVEGRDFWLGGVLIPHEKGALGHSDADVLIHAICDALLGAAALGDIGIHFPDTSQEFKNIDSKILLKRVVELVREKGYRIGNVDTVLILERPKIKPYLSEMIRVMTSVMGVPQEDLSIKATTNEGMGYVGRQEGILAYATALIFKD